MRLIDADVLIKDNGLENAVKYPIGDGHGYDTMMLYEIKYMIDDAPTIDPKDLLPRGEWRVSNITPSKQCSNCEIWIDKYAEYNNYCPNCGARMGGNNE